MSAQDQRGEESSQEVRLAEFRVLGPGAPGQPIPVHFNPETLEYTVTNNIKEQGNSTESKQQVSKSSGKLSMELVFDTTLTGADVRGETEQLQAMMKPVEEGGKKIAPVVEFAWGTYRFRGIFSSYKETLGFFSSTGVPLRASISITMTQQDGLFDPTARGDAVKVDDTETFQPPGDGATGDPETDRGLAESNGEDNPRFFSGKELSVPSGPNLRPPAAFASGSLGLSAGFGLDVGIGVGVGVGFSLGVSAGVGIGLGIEAGIDVGLSAGFDIDIGVDIGVEARIDVRSSGGSSARAGVAVGADADADGGTASAGLGASSTAGAGLGSGRVAGSPSADPTAPRPAGAFGDVAFGGFGSGEFQRSGPGASARSRGGGPAGNRDAGSLEGLPQGPQFGSAASAGVPAALGAFAGLRTVGPRRHRPVMLSKLRAQRPERNLRTDTGASFEIGGRASERASDGLAADVGAKASLADRIAFDDSLGEG